MRALWQRGPAYSGIIDKRMADGSRTYAGDPSEIEVRPEIGDCPNTDATYDASECLSFAPTVVITHNGHISHALDVREHDDRFCLLEVIDEPFTDVGPGTKAPSCPQPAGSGFGCVPHTVYNRVVLGFVVERDGKLVIPTVGYYDSLRADITVTVH